MDTAGLDYARIKLNVIAYWRQEARNWPVRAISATRGKQLGAKEGSIVPTRGYFTVSKAISGRALPEIEAILGLIPGELRDGAFLLRLNRLPHANEFELRAMTHRPGGKPFVEGGAYPPGGGVGQWELVTEIPATVVAFAAPGERKRV